MAVAVTACASGVGDVTSSTTVGPSTTVPTSLPSTTTTDPAGPPALALFLATIDKGLDGTQLEGVPYEDPEPLIRTGVLFCSLLDKGVGPVDVLRAWVAALSADGSTPGEEDLLLGGVVLGAAVRFLCPEYLPDLEL